MNSRYLTRLFSEHASLGKHLIFAVSINQENQTKTNTQHCLLLTLRSTNLQARKSQDSVWNWFQKN